ncbi:MAG: MBL fold metallo-hydrolase [Spirosomataceae bacterium]
MEKIEIRFYKVKCGDCTYLRYTSLKKTINIIIDAGYYGTYKTTLKKDASQIKERGEKIDLFVVTHIDRDHIGGIQPFLNDFGTDMIKEFWFNHADRLEYREKKIETEISVKQGSALRDKFHSEGRSFIEITAGNEYIIDKSIKLKILSPSAESLTRLKNEWVEEEKKFEFEISSKGNDYQRPIEELYSNPIDEDKDPINGSSIAFLLEIKSFNALFCADAHPSILYESLRKLGYSKANPLKLSLFKVPHHGSKRNISNDLLDILDCQNFVFSANGMNRDNLPNKETIAKIVKNPNRKTEKKMYFYFNYDNSCLRGITTHIEQETYNFNCFYTQSTNNYLETTFENGLLNFA